MYPRKAFTNNFYFHFYIKKSHTVKTDDLVFWIPFTPAFVFLATSQGATLPLGSSSQSLINKREALTFPTGLRTLASILQSVTSDLGPEQGKPIKMLIFLIQKLTAFIKAGKLRTVSAAAQKEWPDIDWSQQTERGYTGRQRDPLAPLTHLCSSPEGTKRR